MVSTRDASAAAAGMLADLVLGEPPEQIHPVALFGRAMGLVERSAYRDSRVAGGLHCALGAGVGMACGLLTPTAVATFVAVGGRELERAARRVQGALESGDLEGARRLLPALVGRDPAGLDEKEVVRAVVESVAENTVDAVVAPALWAALAGAPGALGYRAVNTLDAMVGHRSERYGSYGWASARLDDLAGWVPARVTAGLVAMVRPRAAGAVRRAVRIQAPAHPSPNSGVAEAAFAAALGVRLGGQNRYGENVELRPNLGTGRAPERADIERSVALARDVGVALAVLLAAVGIAGELASRAGDSRRRFPRSGVLRSRHSKRDSRGAR
ncbi:MAG TPA: adenosylcobinamide-phosphate synthase CbiB [Acidimicrobiales bacterium]|nr:adenosylcobinamide-phosphate synthase CbiB [Acidimicrobiales bacterium]